MPTHPDRPLRPPPPRTDALVEWLQHARSEATAGASGPTAPTLTAQLTERCFAAHPRRRRAAGHPACLRRAHWRARSPSRRNTVLPAYEQLRSEGFVVAGHGFRHLRLPHHPR
jgi:DNA-binding transcriptional MocR family regulator